MSANRPTPTWRSRAAVIAVIGAVTALVAVPLGGTLVASAACPPPTTAPPPTTTPPPTTLPPTTLPPTTLPPTTEAPTTTPPIISLPGITLPALSTTGGATASGPALSRAACTPATTPPATRPPATAPPATAGSTPHAARPHPHRSPTVHHPSRKRVVKVPDPFRPLSIHTFPAVPGVRFRFGKRVVVSNSKGVATFTLTKAERDALGANRATVLTILSPTVQVDSSHRAMFAGWIGKGTYKWHTDKDPGAIEVASFSTDQLVSFSFYSRTGGTVPATDLGTFQVESRAGADLSLDPKRPNWLLSTEVVTGSQGPVLHDVGYSVTQVMVKGTNVVHGGMLPFTPARSPNVYLELLFFRVTFHAGDTLFGSSVGTSLLLRYPDRSTTVLPLVDGAATASNLPRGSYEVTVLGAGPKIVRPVSISRSQVMKLDVVTWTDVAAAMAVGAIACVMVLGAAVLTRRRHRRRADSPAPAPPSSLGLEGAV